MSASQPISTEPRTRRQVGDGPKADIRSSDFWSPQILI
jgi:hypothetical protein